MTNAEPRRPYTAVSTAGDRELKVLFISHTYIAPKSQLKLSLLAERGVEVGLVAPMHWRAVDGLFSGQRIALQRGSEGIALYGVNTIRTGHIASFVYSPLSLWRAIRRFNPDILHVEHEVYSFASAQAAMCARILQKKLVVFGWENLDRPVHPMQRLARQIVIRQAQALITGNSEGARLVRTWGFQGVVDVMPQLGVDLREFRPRVARPDHKFRIGYVGRLVPEKGVDILLKALAILAQQGVDVEAMVCGSGPAIGDLQRLASELRLQGRLRWQTAVPHEHVPQVLSELDVLVLPSRETSRWKEQFGLILAQAMAMGVLVVGSQSGAIPEVVGRPDVVFPQGDTEQLARLLRKLAKDSEWRKELVEYGIARAKRHFAVEVIADRLAEFYRSLDGQSGPKLSTDAPGQREDTNSQVQN
jgi:glycosyltransferase involved in cell wall biosynthesis